MEFMDVIRKRKTTNGYVKEDPVSREHQMLLMEAAGRAPSHMNSQPWRFIMIDDKEKIRKIAKIAGRTMRKSMEGSFFKENRKYFRFSRKEIMDKRDGMYFSQLPAFLGPMVRFLFERDVIKRLKSLGVTKILGADNEDLVAKSPLLIAVLYKEDEYGAHEERLDFYYNFAASVAIGMSIENLWLTCTDLGIGIQFVSSPKHYPEAWQEIRNILKIPEEMKLMALLRLGYELEKSKSGAISWESDIRKRPDQYVHRNEYGNMEKSEE